LSDDKALRQRKPKVSRNKAVIAIVTVVAAGVAVLVAFLSHTPSGNSATAASAAALFSAFSAPAAGPADGQVRAIADDAGADGQDLSSVRTLSSELGRFHSRLVAFPSFHGQNICYSLLGAQPTDPGMTYCYRPHYASAPAGLADERFSVSALEGHTGPGGDVGTQVFGVAEDGVVGARVLVAGTWHTMPITDNALYLDLPGVPRSDVSTVEVTLSDGSTQLHDLQTGL
jgi:hypothetical protein